MADGQVILFPLLPSSLDFSPSCPPQCLELARAFSSGLRASLHPLSFSPYSSSFSSSVPDRSPDYSDLSLPPFQ